MISWENDKIINNQHNNKLKKNTSMNFNGKESNIFSLQLKNEISLELGSKILNQDIFHGKFYIYILVKPSVSQYFNKNSE